MPSIKNRVGFKNRRAHRAPLQLENLERRFALAGDVTAQVVGSTLMLTGDALDNQVVVASVSGGKFAVLGNNTTINGLSSVTSPFVTTKPITNIVANLNGGSDSIGFGNSASGFATQLSNGGITIPFDIPTLQAAIDSLAAGATTFSLPGSLTVNTAAGNDNVGIIGLVGGSVAVNLGSALTDTPYYGNYFAVGDPSADVATNRIGGGLSVLGGAQRDLVFLSGSTVVGAVNVGLGDGYNYCSVVGNQATFGAFAYTGGKNFDSAEIGSELTVKGDVSFRTGEGEDEVNIYSPASVGGSVVVDTGTGNDDDYVSLETVYRENKGRIRGGVSVTTGGGADTLYVEDSLIGLGLTINCGAGDDDLEITDSTVGVNTVIDAGAGNDEVAIDGLATRYNLFVYLGAGNDSLVVDNATAFAAFLYGGLGTNSLTTNAATRNGIRTLRSYQFQTVNNGG